MSEDNVTLGTWWEQLGKALRYKPEGRGFDCRWCHCNFIDVTSPAALWSCSRLILLGVKAASLKADNPTTFMCQCSQNLGVSTAWIPLMY